MVVYLLGLFPYHVTRMCPSPPIYILETRLASMHCAQVVGGAQTSGAAQ